MLAAYRLAAYRLRALESTADAPIEDIQVELYSTVVASDIDEINEWLKPRFKNLYLTK